MAASESTGAVLAVPRRPPSGAHPTAPSAVPAARLLDIEPVVIVSIVSIVTIVTAEGSVTAKLRALLSFALFAAESVARIDRTIRVTTHPILLASVRGDVLSN